jgi:type VII secretion-associated protein (TIGR03931 family)
VTAVVVEVGPGTVRGPNDARADWISAALECVDDDIALIDDRPVSVAEVWREVVGAAIGGAAETVVLVCPTWWSSSRVDRVYEAARTVATNVEVLRRASVLADGFSTVVEIAPEHVVVSRPGRDVVVVMSADGPAAVAGVAGASAAAVVDAPVGVEGADVFGMAIAERLRAEGISVSIAERDFVRRAVAALRARKQDDGVDAESPRQRNRRGAAALAGTLMSVAALCGGFAGRTDKSEPSSMGTPMTLLVEGRVGVKVPAQWAVQRVTTGPGSARVQVVSPSDADIVVHITQSSIPSHQTLAMVADTLRNALAEEPTGVFADFNPADRRADKPAVTYREVRAEHEVAWTVLTDDGVRIAIGCQNGPHREHLVRDACDQAIQSAHAVF